MLDISSIRSALSGICYLGFFLHGDKATAEGGSLSRGTGGMLPHKIFENSTAKGAILPHSSCNLVIYCVFLVQTLLLYKY